MTAIYHYTCEHAHAQIGTEGVLIPHGIPAITRPASTPATGHRPTAHRPSRTTAYEVMPLVWLTDLDAPARDALGLTSHLIDCDRTQHRYRVTDLTSVQHWLQVRRSHPLRDELEHARGARPMHWYVSLLPVSVIYDPTNRHT